MRIKIVEIPVDWIRPNEYNPNEMSKEDYQFFKEDMSKGLPYDPVEISEIGVEKNHPVYEITDGDHRWNIAR